MRFPAVVERKRCGAWDSKGGALAWWIRQQERHRVQVRLPDEIFGQLGRREKIAKRCRPGACCHSVMSPGGDLPENFSCA